MAWRYEKAHQRVQELIGEAPEIDVLRFADDYLPDYEMRKSYFTTAGESVAPPLFNLEKGAAILVDTVQIYISITNYDEFRIEERVETEASHERALRFLHTYYSACDRVAEFSEVQRVDFHGGRMHAVVLEPSADGVTPESVIRAFSFVRDFRLVADQANRELANSEFEARFRVGIDAGPCVAINNGTGIEQEPMFLGSAANHAARLADGDQPGIFVSDRISQILGQPSRGHLEFVASLDEDFFARLVANRDEELRASDLSFSAENRSTDLIDEWREEIRLSKFPDPTIPKFEFHYQPPPLSEIEYANLIPSNSIRMSMVSIYADLSNFTAYIDDAMQSGFVSDAVKALYVIREEFQNVVEQDFDGRKVRFIGDCIHAILAEGSQTATEGEKSVTTAVSCAGGLRSSFQVCQSELDYIEQLGLTIGVEFGSTPVSRLGIRGERSVRIASSVATTTSEQMQQDCIVGETRLGPMALTLIPSEMGDFISATGSATDMTYDDVSMCLSADSAAPIEAPYVRAHSPSDGTTHRAHLVSQ